MIKTFPKLINFMKHRFKKHCEPQAVLIFKKQVHNSKMLKTKNRKSYHHIRGKIQVNLKGLRIRLQETFQQKQQKSEDTGLISSVSGHRMQYPKNTLFKSDGTRKILSDKGKLGKFSSSRLALKETTKKYFSGREK